MSFIRYEIAESFKFMVNLVGFVESHEFCLQDPWWNPAVEEQAVMRIHRIGQTKRVMIKRFIVKVNFLLTFVNVLLFCVGD